MRGGIGCLALVLVLVLLAVAGGASPDAVVGMLVAVAGVLVLRAVGRRLGGCGCLLLAGLLLLVLVGLGTGAAPG
jgi:hypothetical protein